MGYQLRNNHCEGWWQGVFRNPSGSDSESAKFSTQEEAVQAVRHHHSTGLWPREVVEKDIMICERCGQPLPE